MAITEETIEAAKSREDLQAFLCFADGEVQVRGDLQHSHDKDGRPEIPKVLTIIQLTTPKSVNIAEHTFTLTDILREGILKYVEV